MKATKGPLTGLYPVPVVLVSCGVERPNLITLAWAGVACSEPPALTIAIRPSRHSHGLIVDSGEFVVNLPRARQVGLVDYCGNVSGRDVDKWSACGLTPLPAAHLETPIVAECPVSIECRVVHRLPLGSHDLFVGQVLAVQVDEELLDENGHLRQSRAEPLGYVGGEYWRLESMAGHHGDWRPRPAPRK
jgi:flavin reductase (DIM6/NTAB) family NADH-FMN oxidoreductase RutF